MAKKAIRATYTAGQVAEFEHQITAHHFGALEMKICNETVGNNCANQWTLIRAEPPADCVPNDSRTDCQPIDVRHPERMHLPPRRNLPQKDQFRYIIPADLSCESCTLQWRWWTANSGVGQKDYGCYWDQLDAAGGTSSNFHGYFSGKPCGSDQAKNVEQFFGCSDITVLPGGPTPAPTTAAPTPAPPPTPALPPTPQPTTAPPPPAPAHCCTGSGTGGEGCFSPCTSTGWCGASESNCGQCGGSWCGGSSPTPPAPTPVVNPTPTPPAPTPPAPGPSVCCYDPGCTGNCVAGGWCGGSEDNCVGCGGEWCSSAAVLVHNSTLKRVQIHTA